VLARAAELAAPSPATGQRGRLVAIATSSVLRGATWQLPELRSTARFADGVLGWLLAEPLAEEDPAPEPSAAPRMTEETLSGALRYSLLYAPLGVVLLGVAVAIRRRSKPGSQDRPAGKARPKEPR
jgi:hypothetical protein